MIDVSSDNDEIVDPSKLDSQFGTSEPKNMKKFEKTTYFTFKNGDNIFRIMPAMFSCLETGHWSCYYGKHFGYYNEDGKPVNYVCLREYDNQSGALTQECPFCVDQENKKKLKENYALEVNHFQNLAHQAQDPDERAKLLEQLDEAKANHSKYSALYNPRSARFWVNAMNMNGEFGLLGLPKTVYEALVGKKVVDKNDPRKFTRTQGLLQRVKEKDKIDALSVNEGVWFNISRAGSTQYDTEYSTLVVKEEIELPSGDVVEKTRRASLSDQQKRDALIKCKDLKKVFDYLILTTDDAKLVVNGSGKAVTAVNNAPRKVTPENAPSPVQIPAKVNNQSLLDKFRKLDTK